MKYLFAFFIVLINFSGFAQNSLWTINRSAANIAPPSDTTQVRKYDFNGSYNLNWTSNIGTYEDFVIGDSDNDGIDELILIDQEKFYVYETSVDTPIVVVLPTPHYIGNIVIADADNDGNNEIVIQHQLQGGLLIYSFGSGYYNLVNQISNSGIWWAEVGDADNDGLNELIIPDYGFIALYGYDSLTTNYLLKYNIPSPQWNDMTIVRDVDNDGLNEVISGGSFSAVRIWEYNGTDFVQIGSQPVSGYSQGVEVGDTDNDGSNELVVGTTLVYVYDFSNGNFNLEWSTNLGFGVTIAGIEIGDSDNDGNNELAMFGGEVRIFKYDSVAVSYNTQFEDPSGLNVLIDSFNLTVPWNPIITVHSVATQSAGSEYSVVIEAMNLGASVDSFSGTLSSIDPSINITQNQSTFPPLGFEESGDNAANPFVFSLISPPAGGTILFSIEFSINGDPIGSGEFEITITYNQFVEISETIGFTPLTWDVIDLFFTDVNNDGYPDIYLNPEFDGSRTLFLGNISHSFQYQTIGGPFRYCRSNCFTDINNDFYMELYESNYLGTSWGANLLFLNNVSSFINISASSGTNYTGEGQGTVSFDYNNDGYLDLFLSNGIGGVEYDILFENNGDSTFTDVSNLVGINYQANGQHVASGDINNDGLMDLYVVNFNNPNNLLIASISPPDSQVTYTDIATQAGVDVSGRFFAADFGDFNNDGWLDIILAGLDSSKLFLNNGNNSFQDISTISGVENIISMDIALFDCDQDGLLDVFLAGSHRSPRSNNVLLKNNNDLTFSDITNLAGLDVETIGYCAMADYNLDGFPDIALAGQGLVPASQFYHNNGTTNNWLSMKLHGVESNSLGIGARINLWAGGVYQIREVNANLGNDVVVNFGLSNAAIVDSIRINWPSGITQYLIAINPNQILNVVEESIVTWIDQHLSDESIPVDFALLQNYPNPFNPTTKIKYAVSSKQFVSLKIYDILGNEIVILVNEEKPVGTYEIEFSANSHSGSVRNLPSGIYFYRLQAGDFVETKKMVLMK